MGGFQHRPNSNHWLCWSFIYLITKISLATSTRMFHNDHGFVCIFRCLFLPSLATVKGVSADSIATGGIGGGKKKKLLCSYY